MTRHESNIHELNREKSTWGSVTKFPHKIESVQIRSNKLAPRCNLNHVSSVKDNS